MHVHVLLDNYTNLNIRIFAYLNMGKLYVDISDDVATIFRMLAIQKFGTVKGHVSIAAEEAIAKWVNTEWEKNGSKLRVKGFQK